MDEEAKGRPAKNVPLVVPAWSSGTMISQHGSQVEAHSAALWDLKEKKSDFVILLLYVFNKLSDHSFK